MPLEVLVIISPKPGKEKRVSEILTSVTESAKATEPYTLSYHSYSTTGDEEGTVDYVVSIRLKDEEALVKRRELKHHQDIARYIEEEDLLRRPMRYMKLDPFTGFDRLSGDDMQLDPYHRRHNTPKQPLSSQRTARGIDPSCQQVRQLSAAFGAWHECRALNPILAPLGPDFKGLGVCLPGRRFAQVQPRRSFSDAGGVFVCNNDGMLRLSFFLCFFLALTLPFSTAQSDYYERLDLQPLPLGSLLASFNFRSNESLAAFDAQNFRFFPRSLGQILRHANTKELHLRFSTGRWDAETWGARPWDGFKEGGTGVELWAWIEAATDAEAVKRWSTLTQSLSGLFCASINFIDSTRTTKPTLSFAPTGDHDADQQLHFLHGVLPGEVVCTENLTPFLKLLPCKGKAGISSLLDGHKVFDASWQSMSVDVRPVCPSDAECHLEISQTIDMVLDIARSKRPRDNPIPRPVPNEELVCDHSKPYHSQDNCYPLDMVNSPGWSLHDVFGRPMAGSCPVADDEGPNANSICIEVPHSQQIFISASGWEAKSAAGQLPESRCYQVMPSQDFDMHLPEQQQQPGGLSHELLHVSRTITGHGASTGGLRTTLTNPSATDPITFIYFETLPWFMRPFIHTLRASLTHTAFPFAWAPSLITSIHYTPARDRQRPTALELLISLPPASTATLTYDFEKAVLRYTEYPPDANRGFNVAPAVIRILDETNAAGSRKDVYIRTTSLLLPLPTPDFSMPYNVIILTSTVMALAFGSVFNLLVRRFVGVDEVPKSALANIRDRVLGRLVAVKDRFVGKDKKIE